MGQEVRDHVGTLLLRVTLRELFLWRFMQVRGQGLSACVHTLGTLK